jgi:phosphoglycolate phosphatase-like HAD superfamily hydrolase
MARTRGGLARLAIREARSHSWIGRATPISLIGDAPPDVIAARENHIRSIAVQTGITPPADLVAEHPDFVLRSLHDLRLRMIET